LIAPVSTGWGDVRLRGLVWMIVERRDGSASAERWHARNGAVKLQDAEIVSSDRIGDYMIAFFGCSACSWCCWRSICIDVRPRVVPVDARRLLRVTRLSVTPARTVAGAFIGYLRTSCSSSSSP
jgi:hypothetical protein